MAQSHLIYRQILEISFPSKKEALDGQNTISQLYRREVMPLINEVCDELAPANDHIRIDRLEIDVGRLTAHNMEEDLRQGLRTMLEDELLKEIQKAYFHRYRNGDEGKLASDRYRPEERLVRSPDQSDIELFTYFVKTGRLPWWTGREQTSSLEELAATLIENQPGRLLELLLELIPSRTYARRIIYQFPDHILLKCIELKQWAAGTGKQIKDLHRGFHQIHKQKQIIQLNQSNFRLLLWQCAFDYWFFPGDHPSKSITSGNWKLEPLKNTESDDIKKPKLFLSSPAGGDDIQSYLLYMVKVLAGRGISSTIPEENYEKRSEEEKTIYLMLHRMVEMGIQNQPLGKMTTSLANLSASNLKKTLQTVDPNRIKETGVEEHKEESREMLESEDTFEISNAGLVIVVPFLTRFFDNLGLVSEKTFVTEDAAMRAALLLQYVATGQTEMAEYNIILNKLLCGLPVDEPVSRKLEISDPERNEVENLLQSVVEHWGALKGTSTEGLRETFLVKEGLLNKEVNGWRLRIERTTVDVLLDRLPWSISIIKLPWNEEMIHVEW